MFYSPVLAQPNIWYVPSKEENIFSASCGTILHGFYGLDDYKPVYLKQKEKPGKAEWFTWVILFTVEAFEPYLSNCKGLAMV